MERRRRVASHSVVGSHLARAVTSGESDCVEPGNLGSPFHEMRTVSRWESDPLKVPQLALDVFAAYLYPLPTSLLPLSQTRIVCNVEVLEPDHTLKS
ncbi:hypothetical protein HYQ46_008174 [Verticillium longisporum]|nr:hypothetical protein HYQ46_008174 [Verticillium longisporum]